jgi:hypothetical protein
LSQAVTNSVDIDLYIDNVKQDPTTYSVSGTALTTSTIASPSTMYCIYNGRAMQTVNPPDSSVSSAKIIDGTIVNADINTSADIATTKLGAGAVVQVVNHTITALVSGTATMPSDDSIPQISEGVATTLTRAIIPTHASNKLKIDVVVLNMGFSGANNSLTVALFQDDTAGALAGGIVTVNSTTAARPDGIAFSHYMAAGTTSSTTMTVRFGCGAAGTSRLNSWATGRALGGVSASSITITEIAV